MFPQHNNEEEGENFWLGPREDGETCIGLEVRDGLIVAATDWQGSRIEEGPGGLMIFDHWKAEEEGETSA